MVKSVLAKVLIPSFCLGALATACTPTQKPAAEAPMAEAPAAGGAETSIVLPDGTECLFAGRGATLTYEGKRLNYTCGSNTGLIGSIVIADGSTMTLEKATLDGTTITASEPMTLMVSEVDLADGTVCLNAGQGATLAFEGKRLNFTCPDAATETGLIGNIEQADGVFGVEMATLDGTTLVSTARVDISTLKTAMP